MQVNLKSFKQKAKKHEKSFKSFLSKIGRKPPKDLDKNDVNNVVPTTLFLK